MASDTPIARARRRPPPIAATNLAFPADDNPVEVARRSSRRPSVEPTAGPSSLSRSQTATSMVISPSGELVEQSSSPEPRSGPALEPVAEASPAEDAQAARLRAWDEMTPEQQDAQFAEDRLEMTEGLDGEAREAMLLWCEQIEAQRRKDSTERIAKRAEATKSESRRAAALKQLMDRKIARGLAEKELFLERQKRREAVRPQAPVRPRAPFRPQAFVRSRAPSMDMFGSAVQVAPPPKVRALLTATNPSLHTKLTIAPPLRPQREAPIASSFAAFLSSNRAAVGDRLAASFLSVVNRPARALQPPPPTSSSPRRLKPVIHGPSGLLPPPSRPRPSRPPKTELVSLRCLGWGKLCYWAVC